MLNFMSKFNKLCDILEKIIYWAVVMLFSMLIITVFLQVIARYLLDQPWLWTTDVSLLLLVWATFLGSAAAVRSNSHFLIDLWPIHYVRTIFYLSLLSIAVVLFISSLYVYYGWEYALVSAKSRSGMTSISMFYFLLSIPVGSLLMMVFSLEALGNQLINRPKERV